MTAVIRTRELTKRYRSVSALERLNLDVQEGSLYALVGPNGAGKTTAIKILMNLIEATGGQAEVLGMDSKSIRGTSYARI
jgi:ABC-2 type transport system ATP-binding protein